MSLPTGPDDLGRGLRPGDRHHRAFVGFPEQYDLGAATQFALLSALGLREDHDLLDVGCGSLRAGRLFIVFLRSGRYCGLEPERWLVEAGIDRELGRDVLALKQPSFAHDENFALGTFGRQFDFINAQSVFSHASEAQIRRCLAEARKVMRPSAIFAATFVRGPRNYRGDGWVYPSVVTYTLRHFLGLVEAAGLRARRLDWRHPTGQTWLAITHPEFLRRLPPVRDPGRPARGARALALARRTYWRLRRRGRGTR